MLPLSLAESVWKVYIAHGIHGNYGITQILVLNSFRKIREFRVLIFSFHTALP